MWHTARRKGISIAMTTRYWSVNKIQWSLSALNIPNILKSHQTLLFQIFWRTIKSLFFYKHCSDCRKITTTCSSDREPVCRVRHCSVPSSLSAHTLPSPSLTVRWHFLWPTARRRPAGSRFYHKSAMIPTRTATRRSRYVAFSLIFAIFWRIQKTFWMKIVLHSQKQATPHAHPCQDACSKNIAHPPINKWGWLYRHPSICWTQVPYTGGILRDRSLSGFQEWTFCFCACSRRLLRKLACFAHFVVSGDCCRYMFLFIFYNYYNYLKHTASYYILI